jgi:hypothetical protein
MNIRLAMVCVVATTLPAAGALAQSCDTVSSRTSLSAFAGARIGSLRIVTQSPAGLPGVAGALDKFHVRTRERTVRRQLLFSAGDTLDTLAVAESIRRLRSERYLRDVELRGVRCDAKPVDLVLTTRDDWSVKPKLQMRSTKSELGLTERNLFGSGRALSLQVRSQQGRVGIGLTLNDPWFLGSPFSATLGHSSYGDGHDLTATLRLREETVHAPWGIELGGIQSEYEPGGIALDRFERGAAHVLVRRRVVDGERAVTSLLGGIEAERARLEAAPGAPIVGPSRASRGFIGLSIGAARTSASYDTLTWLLPRDAIVDVPTSWETEAVVGVGRDAVLAAPMTHVDFWTGKAWLPNRRSLALADVWASGYLANGRWDAAAFRAALTYYGAASRGFWSTRVTAERLLNPDPDVRSFVTIDPTARLLPDRNRLAEAALGIEAERDIRLFPLTRSWALSGAVFAAASSRWESVEPSPEHVDVATLGLGLRLTPARLGRATARLDIGYPIAASSSLASRSVYVGIGLSPWWGDDRHRAGRRD